MVFVLVMLAVMLCSLGIAADWPQIEKRLATWDGAKEVQLPAEVDPLEDPLFAPVVELFLNEGFAVRTETQATAPDGLILKQHQGESGTRLVLSRARDGALLALEPLSGTPPTGTSIAGDSTEDKMQHSTSGSDAKMLSTSSVSRPRRVTAPAQPLRIESGSQVHTMGMRSASPSASGAGELVDMPGTPRSIATWAAAEAAAQDFHLFALYDSKLIHFCYRSGRLEQIAEFIPPARVSRALRLECSDFDGDGVPELAPVWVEDVYSVDEGTESRLHSWIVKVRPEGGMKVGSPDLNGYLAKVEGQLYLQERGEYSAFASDVYAVEFANGTYRPSDTPVSQAQHWIFNHARWPDSGRVLIWNDDQRLVLAARSGVSQGHGTYATGTLLSDFGSYLGASIYVPLEEPEYRSGFSAHDKVMSQKIHVPRRMLPHGKDLFTLARGREAGMPLVGKPSGQDKLVQINVGQTGLQARFPFTPVNAFILDFDLMEQKDRGLSSVLLLNEKQDGKGKAYLQVQHVD